MARHPTQGHIHVIPHVGAPVHHTWAYHGPYYHRVAVAGGARSDREIKRDVKDALSQDMWLGAHTINVEVKDRVVTITGLVDSLMEKVAAGEDAWNIPGVADVNNNVEIVRHGQSTLIGRRGKRHSARSEKRTRGTESSDVEVRRDVWTVLANDIRVDPDQVEADVNGGTVFLRGTVSSLYDMRVLTEMAGRIKGVLGVVNEVQVVPATKRPDHEIAEMIYDAMDVDPFIPYDADIDVTCDAGVVVLTGTMTNKRAKHASGDISWGVPGVTDVRNEIKVAGCRRTRTAPKETEGRNI